VLIVVLAVKQGKARLNERRAMKRSKRLSAVLNPLTEKKEV